MKKICVLRFLNIVLPVLFILGTFIYVTFKWTKSYFGRHLDVEAIVFTLMLPVDGVDRNIVFSYLKVLAVALPLTLLLACGYFRLLKRLSGAALAAEQSASGRPPSHRRRQIGYGLLLAAGLAYFVGAAYYLEHRKRLISFLMMPKERGTMFEEQYRPLRPEEAVFVNKRNVVLIILESIEETYNDESLFGEKLMPGLARLRAEHLSFYGGRETRGADWTVGALTAYTLGLPLAFARESTMVNYFGEASDEFLPRASSILRIFEDHGYRISFFLGSGKTFAGQDKLLGSHSRAAEIYDLERFEKKRLNGELDYRRSNWGVPDRLIYAEAKDYLREYPGDAPFLLIMQTVDTHIGDGNFNGLMERKWGDLRDCVAEADQMAADFVAWLQGQSFYENTTVILLGDHLLPRDELGPVKLPDRGRRETYNVFINTGFENNGRRRDFAAFDLAPTILAAAGASWPGGRLGLGRSLFENSKTLFEDRGRKYYEQEVRKKSSFYESLFRRE